MRMYNPIFVSLYQGQHPRLLRRLFVASRIETVNKNGLNFKIIISPARLHSLSALCIADKKYFEFQSPSKNILPLNSPKLQEVNLNNLEEVFDIRLTSMSKYYESTATIYQDKHNVERTNGALQQIDGAYAILQQKYHNCFTENIAYRLTDFYNNCQSKSPYDSVDERTKFVEICIPIFTTFSNILGRTSFVCMKRQSESNKSIWVPLYNYETSNISTRLADGIKKPDHPTAVNIIIIESSGLNKVENVTHIYVPAEETVAYKLKWHHMYIIQHKNK
ncbi:hypothetical protein K501DRAFT_280298 [Backusella circina FSU 941]|nr:hypothetical protein K501DRAFT_280298 [Backusella circina FSU 941]